MTASHFHLSDSLHQRPSNSTLLIAVVGVINHIYAKYTGSITFSLWSRTAAADSVQKDLLTEILSSLHDTELRYIIEDGGTVQCGGGIGELFDDQETEERTCLQRQYVFLMVDSFEAFMLFRNEFTKRNFDTGGFFSIIYTGQKHDYYEEVTKILQEMFAIYMLNVDVYVELPRETLVYTYYPFTQYHCNAVLPVVLNRFGLQDRFVYKASTFKHKTENLHGCHITVATWNSPPFISFSKGLHLKGIEGSLLNTLAQKMNFSIKVVDAAFAGTIFPNHTVTKGAIRLVIDGEANLTISSFLYSNNLMKRMLASYPYTSYPMVVAVPRGLPLTSFQRLMRPFKYIIWSCLSSSVLAGIVIIYIIKYIQKRSVRNFVFGRRNSTPVMNLLEILFGGQVTVTPRRNFARYILLVWLVCTMVLRNAYTGELFYLLQDSTARNSLKSIEELVEKNFTIMCAAYAKEVLLESVNTRNRKILRRNALEDLPLLHDANSKQAMILLSPFLRHYNQNIRGRSQIPRLPKSLATVPLTMYLRRNSYLHRSLNDHLLNFMSSGMLTAWERHHLSANWKQVEEERATAILSVKLLKAVFIVYLFLLGVSMLVFLLELWSRYSPISRAIINFLNY